MTAALPQRRERAWTLTRAIEACHPADAANILSEALERLSIGMPIAPLFGTMDAAESWAALATRAELKAYCLACYRKLTPTDQRAFIAYVQGASQ